MLPWSRTIRSHRSQQYGCLPDLYFRRVASEAVDTGRASAVFSTSELQEDYSLLARPCKVARNTGSLMAGKSRVLLLRWRSAGKSLRIASGSGATLSYTCELLGTHITTTTVMARTATSTTARGLLALH